MNRKLLLWAMAIVVAIPVVFGTGYWLYWSQIKRFEPVIINDPVAQVELQKLLDQSGAVSSGGDGPKLWLITYRDCEPCRLYQTQEFPDLQAAGIDTRIIVFVRPDDKGLPQSTAAERTTVAELWLNRSWTLYQAWSQTPEIQWKAENLTPADTDLARQGVVLATQVFIQRIGQYLTKDRAPLDYPLILYRDKGNQLKVCACTNPRSFGFVRSDLGVSAEPLLPPAPSKDIKLPALPAWLGGASEKGDEPPVQKAIEAPAVQSETTSDSASSEIEEVRPIPDAGDW